MGRGYKLKCTRCGEIQNLKSGGNLCDWKQDRKAQLLRGLSEEAKSELTQIEEIYKLSDENIRVFIAIGRCCECFLLREIFTFIIPLSKSFKLINSDSHYCKKCCRHTDECITPPTESCYKKSSCAKCDNLGLEIISSIIYD